MDRRLIRLNVWSFAVPAAIVSGYWFALRRAREAKINTKEFESSMEWAIGGGLVISHMVEILLYQPQKLKEGWWTLFKFWDGLSSYGGFFGAILACTVFYRILRRRRWWLEADLIIQGLTVAICAGLAVLIACLGLFALSAYTTERRTKEIGVRKAMGADTRQVVLLLLWQFTIPVLVAIVIAIPLVLWAMNWWLHGFVYHVSLSALTFVLAAVAGVVIAWVTVSWQSFTVARAKPAGALRYE